MVKCCQVTCDMGIFDFFFRSSSRTRSQTTTETISNANLTAPTANVQHEPLDQRRHSMPPLHNGNDGSDDEEETAKESSALVSIKDYDVIRELGRGATASVHLGKKKDGNDLVALKVFKTSLLKKMREIKREGRKMVVSTGLDKVQMEIAIMKKLNHPHLLNLREVFDDESDTLVLMLDYAPHGQIMHWNSNTRTYRCNTTVLENETGVFDEESLRICVRQLLLGLEYLHKNEICHRDIKPENILVVGPGQYKIGDFGVASILKADESNSTPVDDTKKKGYVTTTAGTYAFMSPEAAKGKGYSAYDADVWALGITIYALALGRIPYYDEDPLALFNQIETQPLDLDNNNIQLSDDLISLLSGMLNKDPDQRFTVDQCKAHPWVTEGLSDEERDNFLGVETVKVQVSEDEVLSAVTRVTSLNVLLRVQMGANKWMRKTREHRTSTSSISSIAENKTLTEGLPSVSNQEEETVSSKTLKHSVSSSSQVTTASEEDNQIEVEA